MMLELDERYTFVLSNTRELDGVLITNWSTLYIPQTIVCARYLDFETLYCYFEYVSNKFIYHVLDNIKNIKKIHFLIQKYICHSCTLEKIYQYSFSKNPVCFSKPLELIYLNLLEFLILFFLLMSTIYYMEHNSSPCLQKELCMEYQYPNIFIQLPNTKNY